jgi:hypothetical protein
VGPRNNLDVVKKNISCFYWETKNSFYDVQSKALFIQSVLRFPHRSKISSHHSVVGILTTLQDGRYEVRIPKRIRDFSVPQNVYTGSGAHPASYSMVPGFFLGDKVVRRESDHSFPSNVEV